ncbi:type IV toxin-antitoxin system AbiEi family antitoxin [Dyella sp. 2RAB6]|uniref:type IV toxin-antitoxin system AbiEi family antitoxin n=1 Tax=Dyella sp. 2RAB6 TaxID=3232992 RepID=UPI003F93E240
MDKDLRQHEHEVLAAAMKAGQAQGLTWTQAAGTPAPGTHQPDALLQAHYAGKTVDYVAEIKTRLRPANLALAARQVRRYGPRGLLVADYVTPPMADELQRQNVPFIDTAGNAYLPTPEFLVWVKGQRPTGAAHTTRTGGRAFTTAGLQVLFTLLCHPDWIDLPYRELAARAGVAHGTIGGVLAELPALGFAITLGKRRRLTHGDVLLRQWVDAYIRTLRPKLVRQRYRAQTLAWATAEDVHAHDLLLGGETAAAQLTGYLRPQTVTLYGRKPDARFLAEHRLLPDPNGNVELLERFWDFPTERAGLAPDVLVYADLMAIGDARTIETADKLHERIVDRFK